MPAEIPPPSLPAINTSRSSQRYHKKPESDMILRVTNLANEGNFCITWPWLDAHHVGIETKACYEISWFPVKRKLGLSPANSDNNCKLACTTNPAQNKERRKQVRMVVGFVPGDSVPADEAAIGLPEFEE